MRGLKRLVTSGVVSGLVASLFVTSNVLAVAGTIGGRPALPRDNEPRSESIFIHTIKKGQTIPDKVLISNNSDEKQTVLVYAVDAIPSSTGAFSCKQRVEPVEDAGKWIHLAKNELTIDANQSKLVDFTIMAPKDADVGEHNACIAFESKQDEGEVTGNLRIRTRSAIRVALTIPGKLHREVSLKDYAVTQENYHQRYTVTLKNSGNVSADTNVKVELRTLFGGLVYQNGGEYPVLAGKSLELPFENDNSPFFGGWFFARASASYDPDATTWGTDHTDRLITTNARDQLIFIWPQPLAMVIILVVLLLVIWLISHLVRRESQRREVYRSWKPYRVQEGDTLQKLAHGTGTSWKRIARVNRLKAPYELTAGKTIHLPQAKTAKKNDTKKG